MFHFVFARIQILLILIQNVMFCCLPLEHTMDLTKLSMDVQKVKARKELWELIAAYTAWMEEWKQLLFSEVTCQMNLSPLFDKMIKCI